MKKRKFLNFMRILLVAAVFSCGVGLASAQNNAVEQGKGSVQDQALKKHGKQTPAERKAAADRFRELKLKALREAATSDKKEGGQK